MEGVSILMYVERNELTHPMDEFGVRITILVIDLVVPMAGRHFLGRTADPFDVRPFLFCVFTEQVTCPGEVVEGVERAAFSSVHRRVILAYPGDDALRQFSGLDRLERFDLRD